MSSKTHDYLEQQVDSADPAHLVELLFQRAVRDLQNAGESWGVPAQSVENVRLVVHAQSILNELANCLNFDDGGTLARDLSRLYEYMQYRLLEAVQSRSGEGVHQVNEVLDLLSSLSDAWSEMVRQQAVNVPENLLSEGKVLVA